MDGPTINVDEERRTMEEARNGEGGNSSFAKEKSSRGEFERPQITGRGCRTVEGEFVGGWKRATGACGGGRDEGGGGRTRETQR